MPHDPRESRQANLWELISRIPEGKCASYAALGRALEYPTSGRIVGRWMANCPEDLPWWRVVAKSGALPLWKRDAAMADQQRQLLEGEGVPFKGDGVDMAGAAWEPF